MLKIFVNIRFYSIIFQVSSTQNLYTEQQTLLINETHCLACCDVAIFFCKYFKQGFSSVSVRKCVKKYAVTTVWILTDCLVTYSKGESSLNPLRNSLHFCSQLL